MASTVWQARFEWQFLAARSASLDGPNARMRMFGYRSSRLVVLGLILLSGCGGESVASSRAPRAQLEPIAPPPTPAADFSTPTAAVKTLLAAAAAGDTATVSQCFAANADREFAPLMDHSATPMQFQEFADFLTDASVGTERVAVNGGSALVAIALRTRDEEIRLTRSDNAWKIVGV